MIHKWHKRIRSRRRRRTSPSLPVRGDPGHRRPGVEPLEDRLLLSAVADLKLSEGGLVQLEMSSSVYDGFYGELHGATIYADAAHTPVISAGVEADSCGTFVSFSGSGAPASPANGLELKRLPPSESSSSPPGQALDDSSSSPWGEGLIDLTFVLNEPVRPDAQQSTDWGKDLPRVAGRCHQTGSTAGGAEQATMNDSRRNGRGLALAMSLGERAADLDPFSASHAGAPGSPYGQIEGARGISQAFELATSPDHGSHAPPREAERGLPSVPPLDNSARSPHRPGSSMDQQSPHATRSVSLARQTSDQAPGLVGARTSGAAGSHEAVMAEMTGTFGDALFNAVYLDDKRPVDLIPLLAVAALGHYLAVRWWHRHDDDRTCLAYPPRRRPTPRSVA